MINPGDLRKYAIRPTLEYLNLYSKSAELLLVGTFYTESTVRGHTRLHQLGAGPALGGYQVEPATHKDVWINYLTFHKELANKIKTLIGDFPSQEKQLMTNLYYATAIARVLYLRHKEPLPEADDFQGLAEYWKKYYNTKFGAGMPSHFVATLNNVT